jgi:hypothetical protein
MQVTESHLRDIVADFIEENPLACRGVLGLCRIEFTDQVGSLAVTLERPPVLRINLAFVQKHCRTETHVKTLLLHEFCHLLLGHTYKFKVMTPRLNLALDAVINAAIHRLTGWENGRAWTEFFSDYYRDAQGPMRLLRRHTPQDSRDDPLTDIWHGLYRGLMVADDIFEIISQLPEVGGCKLPHGGPPWLGNHGDVPAATENDLDLPQQNALAESMDRLRKGLQPPGFGNVRKPFTVVPLSDPRFDAWKRVVAEAFRHGETDRRRRRRTPEPCEIRLPVLSTGDRRAALRTLWNPILPLAQWEQSRPRPIKEVNLYLDVSGSMFNDLPSLLRVIALHRDELREPFWAFSNRVEPARFLRGRLCTRTTGGTSFNCVLPHLLKSGARRAIVLTDGEIEPVDRSLLARLPAGAVTALITPGGNLKELQQAGIRCLELPRLF